MRKIRLDDSCLNHLTSIPVGFARKSSCIHNSEKSHTKSIMYFADRGYVRTSGVARILLQGARALGARVPKFVVKKSSRSESHLELGLQNLRAFANSRGHVPQCPMPGDTTGTHLTQLVSLRHWLLMCRN